MTTPIKRAAASTAATRNKQHVKSYPKTIPLSSPNVQIGELLILLLTGNGQPDGWWQFEQLLHQFYAGGVS